MNYSVDDGVHVPGLPAADKESLRSLLMSSADPNNEVWYGMVLHGMVLHRVWGWCCRYTISKLT